MPVLEKEALKAAIEERGNIRETLLSLINGALEGTGMCVSVMYEATYGITILKLHPQIPLQEPSQSQKEDHE